MIGHISYSFGRLEITFRDLTLLKRTQFISLQS